MKTLSALLEQNDFDRNDLITLLSLEAREDINLLFQKAYETKVRYVGKIIYFRGIIEFSNLCVKNCYYCGIRQDNRNVNRFTMTNEEILEAASFALKSGYGSIVLQSGERSDPAFVRRIKTLLQQIKQISDNKLGVTLSLGEQSDETYRRWFNAGAHRYLLRIETSSPSLYARLHPNDHDFDFRYSCLENLKSIGYQVGTGVMIGLPGQTMADLADDILFLRDNDVDMIGMGPFIPHTETPLADSLGDFTQIKAKQLELSLKMVAVCRLLLRDVNIAATTALQALNSIGRELGIRTGANIIMPNITDTKYRDNYQLYANKPCLDENSSTCKGCLEHRIQSIGESIGYNSLGDSPHFFQRISRTRSYIPSETSRIS